MGQPRWEVRLGSEFVDFDLKSQQQLERAMQAGESQLKLLLAGRSFTVAWSRAADDCWDMAMRSDARPERVRPVRRHAPPPGGAAMEAAMDRDAREEAKQADQRGDVARRRDGSGRSSLGAACERGGGAGAERGGGTGRGGPSGSGGGSGSSGAAAEAAEVDEPAPLRRRSLAPEPEEEAQLGKDKERWVLLTPDEMRAAAALHYTEYTWDHGLTPAEVALPWRGLPSQHRRAARHLGYTSSTWDEEREMQGDLNEELEMQGDRHEKLGLVPGAAADPKPVRVRGHGGKPFSAAEEDELRRGVRLHGNGAWATILRTGSFAAHRTNVDLKDKWRNMARAAEPRSTGTPPPLGGGSEARQRSKRPLSPYSPTTGPAGGGAPRQRTSTPATPATPATALPRPPPASVPRGSAAATPAAAAASPGSR